MNKAIELIKYLIREHEKAGFCTEQNDEIERFMQSAPVAFDRTYQLGRYETLVDLLDTLEKIGE